MDKGIRKALWMLRRMELFRGDPDASLQRLAEVAEIVPRQRNTVLFLPGDANAEVWFLSGGRVVCSRVNREGRSVTAALHEPGALVGGEGIVLDGCREEQAEVVSPSILLRLPHSVVRAEVAASATWATRLALTLARERRELSERLDRLAHADLVTRVAGELYTFAVRHGKETAEGVELAPAPKQRELASYTGAARESVSWALGKLRDRGIVAGSRRRVLVPDMSVLRNVARG